MVYGNKPAGTKGPAARLENSPLPSCFCLVGISELSEEQEAKTGREVGCCQKPRGWDSRLVRS